MAKTTRTSSAKKWTLLALVMFLLVAVIGGTYTRYSSTATANMKTDVAKWQVKLGTTDISTATTTQNITFEVQSNTNVVAGKIAPDVTAKAEVELDLNGTEVAVDFDAVIDESAIASTLGASYDKLTLTKKVDGEAYTSGTVQTIALPGGAKFDSTNGKKKVTLELTWTNDEENNADDSSMGNVAPSLTIPVTLTAKQHIS